MNGYEHYISKHVLLDENLDFVAQTMFNPDNDSPVSSYDFGNLKSRVYAISLCNQHDTWLGMLELGGA